MSKVSCFAGVLVCAAWVGGCGGPVEDENAAGSSQLTDSDFDSDTDSDRDADSESDSESDSDSGSVSACGTDSDSDSDTDSDGDTDSDSDGDSGGFVPLWVESQTLRASNRGEVADFDGDGDLDVIADAGGGLFLLYRNDGSGHFSVDEVPLSFVSQGFGTGDVDDNGTLDFVHGKNNAGGGRVQLNSGAGVFSDPGINIGGGSRSEYEFYVMRLANLDDDATLELVTSADAGIHVFENDGTPSFTQTTGSALPAGTVPRLALSDVDGDGYLDIVSAPAGSSSNGIMRVFLNDSGAPGTFGLDPTQSTLPSFAEGRALVAADLDGDCDEDFIFDAFLGSTTHPTGSELMILENDAGHIAKVAAESRTIVLPGDGTAPGAYGEIATGDLDLDGDVDFMVVETGARVQSFMNDGTGAFFEGPELESAISLVLFDADGDGDLDVFLFTPTGAVVYLTDRL